MSSSCEKSFRVSTVAQWVTVYIAFRLRLAHSHRLSQTTHEVLHWHLHSPNTVTAPNSLQIRILVSWHAEDVCQQVLLLLWRFSPANGKVAVLLLTT